MNIHKLNAMQIKEQVIENKPVEIEQESHHGDKYQSNFIAKYIFSTDHKMIAKQFGITHTQLNRIRTGEDWGHVEV